MKRPVSIFNFKIQNASSESVDIFIDGSIVDASTQEVFKSWFGDETSVSFKSFRNSINSQPAKVYNIYINSGGGLVTDAMAMHDFIVELQSQGKTVNTIGQGIAASAATYILMAGKNAAMSKNSWFMIHNVSGAIWGNVDEIESYANTLRKFNNQARDFYAEYTQMRKEDVAKLMNAETWLTADEAKEKGFIKQVTGEVSFTNSISPEQWDYSNTAVLAAYNSSVGKPPDNSLLSQFQNLYTDMKVSFQGVLNAIKGTKAEANADVQTIVNQIAEAMVTPLEAAAVSIETQMTEAETRITNALIATFEARLSTLEATNAALAATNKQLDTEIETKLGGASNVNNEKPAVRVIGSFNKAVGAE